MVIYLVLVCCVLGIGEWLDRIFNADLHRALKRSKKPTNATPPIEAFSAVEYQCWCDYGVVPERVLDIEIRRLRADYDAGKISLEDYEIELDAMMGIGLCLPEVDA